MDFSVKSLKHVEAFLRKLKKKKPGEKNHGTVQAAAYLGEVIRKHSKENFYWLEHPELKQIQNDPSRKAEELRAWNIFYLWKYPGTDVYPLNKVINYMRNGREDSLVFFADFIIKHGIKGVRETFPVQYENNGGK